MQSMPSASCRCTTWSMPAAIAAGSTASPRNNRAGRPSQPGDTGSRPACVVRMRSALRFMSLTELDVGCADDRTILRALGVEPPRKLRRAGELDLHEGRIEPLAHGRVLARR